MLIVPESAGSPASASNKLARSSFVIATPMYQCVNTMIHRKLLAATTRADELEAGSGVGRGTPVEDGFLDADGRVRAGVTLDLLREAVGVVLAVRPRDQESPAPNDRPSFGRQALSQIDHAAARREIDADLPRGHAGRHRPLTLPLLEFLVDGPFLVL